MFLYCLYMIVFATTVLVPSHGKIEGKHVGLQEKSRQKPEGTMKTIKSESGDIIDCVDLYKQPALNHPLIEHIQMEPSSYPTGVKMEKFLPPLVQDWQRFGECPEGTIPIRRNIQNHYLPPRASQPPLLGKSLSNSLSSVVPNDGHEYAAVGTFVNQSRGASAVINVWNPHVSGPPEVSISQIWVMSDSDNNDLNTMEAGWIVHPERYGDNQTRFFIFWTSNNYQGSGCYDLDCPGFVQTNKKFALGGPIRPLSIYGEKAYDISIVYKNSLSGHWWVKVQDQVLGYWPEQLFTNFPTKDASVVSWGGEIVNAEIGEHHTTTQMGSGDFPSEGFRRAGLMHNLQLIDSSDTMIDPDFSSTQPIVTNKGCYDLDLHINKGTTYGTHFYYGGAGYNPQQCP